MTVPSSIPGTAEDRLKQLHAGQRVLLVEDNPINLEVGVELLKSAGLDVVTATDGLQAVRLASEAFQLILMDVQMPALDGLRATRMIREKKVTTPIVAMTSNAFIEDRLACLEAGMDDHLAKPVEPAILYAMLERWLPIGGSQPQ